MGTLLDGDVRAETVERCLLVRRAGARRFGRRGVATTASFLRDVRDHPMLRSGKHSTLLVDVMREQDSA
ncbi:hypothetical protein [Actinokineospora sp.]|uniref:hypothetical protein n=1 Tax=Actinokineospora sp. TaxID=1872133 RepID=UPI004037A89C